MISPSNYFHRFLDYLLLQNPSSLRMSVRSLLRNDWLEWAQWLMDKRELVTLSKSQVGQDLYAAYILEKVFDIEVRTYDGVFIEFGAFDGVTHSNSYIFEKLGWAGILVEPDPEVAQRCRSNRGGEVLQACVLGNNVRRETIQFSSVGEDGELSSIVGYGKAETSRMASKVLEVPVIHLDELLRKLPQVDILSIDTEGSELDLMRHSDLSVRPKILIIEHNNEYKKCSEIRKIMRQKGYSLFPRAGDFFDDFFVDERT